MCATPVASHGLRPAEALARSRKVVVCLGLFAVLISHNAQTHALVAGEEYRTLDESALLRFVGQNELELQQGRDTILGKYSTKDKTVRSTFRIGGTDVVRYFDVVSDGILRDRTTNRLFYSRKELAKAKKQAEEMARKERERREEAARIELKRQEQESQQASRMRQLAHVLYESAKKGDIEQVSRLLKEGADPNVQPQRHPSALWVSAYNGDANVARTLLDAGAKLESTSILAEDRQFSEDNELYLENLEPRSWERRALRLTELDVAIIRRQPDTVRLLLDRGANPNHFVYRCSQRIGSEKFDMQCLAHFSTPLNLAIQMGYGTEIISELLKHKADPNLASISHPLFLAIEAGSVEITELLIKHGANLNVAGIGGLMLDTGRRGDTRMVELLADQGVRPQVYNCACDSLLFIAAELGNVELARIAITTMGTDPNLKLVADWGHNATSLELASREGQYEVAKYLLDNGADPDFVAEGYTALQRAAEGGHLQIVQLLIEKGAKLNLRTWGKDKSALDLAKRNGHKDVAQLLIESGAK